MKKIVCLAAFTLAIWFPGCKIDEPITDSASMKAFNNETYIWENWTFSTNTVDNID